MAVPAGLPVGAFYFLGTQMARLKDGMANKPRIDDPWEQEPRLPTLNAALRLRLGRQLQNLYDPALSEPPSERITQLLRQLDVAKPPEA